MKNEKKWQDLSSAVITTLPNADPFILLHEDTYYCYGTNSPDGIKAYESKDLKNWKELNNGRNGFVLRKEDVWGEKSFWAPEVYKVKDRFIMYFTADMHISCAVSSSPAGPFVQKEKMPMEQDHIWIDNTLFIDEDGKGYCFFSHMFDNNDGSSLWYGELENDYMTLKKESCQRCLTRTLPWEDIEAKVMEGPFVIKRNGKYFLTYSANGCECKDYAVGYAVADKVKGPYIKPEKAPILHCPAGMSGAGHHSFFTDKEGKLRIVFHVHKSSGTVHPRQTVIGEVIFEGEKMRIGNEFIFPECEKKD